MVILDFNFGKLCKRIGRAANCHIAIIDDDVKLRVLQLIERSDAGTCSKLA